MSPAPQGSFSTFSAGEVKRQRAFGRWRGRAVQPLLQLLTKWRVSPDALSICGLVAILLLPLGFTQSPVYLIVAYALHIFFDGIDGALARYQKITSARGSYLDVVVDHAALLVTVLTLQWFGVGEAFWALLYTACYLLIVVHFVAMNAWGTPPPFPVFRTKFLLFILVVLWGYGVIDTSMFNLFFQIVGIYYVLMVAVYLVLFRWSLPS